MTKRSKKDIEENGPMIVQLCPADGWFAAFTDGGPDPKVRHWAVAHWVLYDNGDVSGAIRTTEGRRPLTMAEDFEGLRYVHESDIL